MRGYAGGDPNIEPTPIPGNAPGTGAIYIGAATANPSFPSDWFSNEFNTYPTNNLVDASLGGTGNAYIGAEPSTVASGGDSGGAGADPSQTIQQLGYDPSDPRDFSATGSGSSVPTAHMIGLIGNFLGNAAFPGLGLLTGAGASKIYQMISNGASQRAVQQAVAAYQQGGGGESGSRGGGFNFNLPGMPQGYDPFGGLPAGFSESGRGISGPNSFSQTGGAPVFTGPGDFGPNFYPGGSIFGGSMNFNPDIFSPFNPAGVGQVGSSSVPAPGGFGGNYGGSGGTLGSGHGSFGNMLGGQILEHAIKFGMIPQNAFGGAAGTWTPAMIQKYQSQGLPNPSALFGGGNAGNKPGAGLPMRSTT